jgi:hypothetical protein
MKNNIQNSFTTNETPFDSSKLENYDFHTLDEIYHLIHSYQIEKGKLFQQYLKLLELIEEEKLTTNKVVLEDAQKLAWEKHLYFDHLIEKCFKETTKRISGGSNGTRGKLNYRLMKRMSNKKNRIFNITHLFKKFYQIVISSYL